MHRLTGVRKGYDWGSPTSIPQFLNEATTGEPVAELWLGAHPSSPSYAEGMPLDELIREDPHGALGPSARYAFGDQLPYLMKLIAPSHPLSLQVHPTRSQAESGYLHEANIADDQRTFRDPNHKPELLYALTSFTALVGFSVRRKVRGLLEGLDTPLSYRLGRRLRLAAGRGMRPVAAWLFDSEDGPSTQEINEFAAACGERLRQGQSPDPLLDELVSELGLSHPGDPAVAVAFLMNPVRLSPGEALYIPPQMLHSYQAGFAIEVMASSDNVIRAGLTSKRVDRELLLDLGVFDAHPPMRVAPEKARPEVRVFNAPVEDFELTLATVDHQLPLPGMGPRVLLCLDGAVEVHCLKSSVTLVQGQSLFASDIDGPIILTGSGAVAQCTVP